MPQLVFVPLIVVVVAGLAWSWWVGRTDRDPASSVDSFHRALSAMQPRDTQGTTEPPAAEPPNREVAAASAARDHA